MFNQRGKFSQVTLVANTPVKILDGSRNRTVVIISQGSANIVQVSSFKDTSFSVGPLINNAATPYYIYGDLAQGEIWLVSTLATQVGIAEYYLATEIVGENYVH